MVIVNVVNYRISSIIAKGSHGIVYDVVSLRGLQTKSTHDAEQLKSLGSVPALSNLSKISCFLFPELL